MRYYYIFLILLPFGLMAYFSVGETRGGSSHRVSATRGATTLNDGVWRSWAYYPYAKQPWYIGKYANKEECQREARVSAHGGLFAEPYGCTYASNNYWWTRAKWMLLDNSKHYLCLAEDASELAEKEGRKYFVQLKYDGAQDEPTVTCLND